MCQYCLLSNLELVETPWLIPSRYPETEKEVEYCYPGDNPFYNELVAICNSQDKNDNNITGFGHRNDCMQLGEDGLLSQCILSLFEDATKTYEFSWKFRVQSEKETC